MSLDGYITVGSSRLWRANVQRAHRAFMQGGMTLWLGAGVSVAYGLPNWNDLVLSLLLRLPAREAHGSRRTDTDWHAYYPHYRWALGRWMMDHFRFDPIRLARVFGDGPELCARIRKELYAPLRADAAVPAKRSTLDAVVDLLAESQKSKERISAVITLNYDDLLEHKLRDAGVPCTAVFGRRAHVEGIPIYHVHGYLPQVGDIPEQDLVFTESAYHQVSSSAFHWSVRRMMQCLHGTSVLFVGLSMVDPNLRRFLDAAYDEGTDQRHFAILSDYAVKDRDLPSAVERIECLARTAGGELGRNEMKDRSQLRTAIQDMCKKAHKYDKKVLNSLGVRPIWTRNHDDVPQVMDMICGRQSIA